VKEFRIKVLEKEECERLVEDASRLVEEIGKALTLNTDYNENDLIALRKLKKETEAVEIFITIIGSTRNNNLSNKDFELANQRVKSDVSYNVKDDFCIAVLKVTVGDYVTYLAHNKSSKNYTIYYKWNSDIGKTFGNGNMGLTKFSMRHLTDNRDNTEQSNITVTEITCKEF